MEIIYLGHSSFKIKSKTLTLITDPYDPQTVGIKYSKVQGDIVTISHEHPDHNKSELVKDFTKLISGPGEYEIKGVSIVGITSFHDDKKGAERGKNTIYVFEIEDYRVAHLGDLGHELTQDQVEQLGSIDVLMIPVGGVYTIGTSSAALVVRLIEPKITIPMHYAQPGLKKEIFGELATVDAFTTEIALPVEKSEKLILKGILLEEQKVVVMKPVNG